MAAAKSNRIFSRPTIRRCTAPHMLDDRRRDLPVGFLCEAPLCNARQRTTSRLGRSAWTSSSPTRSGRERSSRNESLMGQDPAFHCLKIKISCYALRQSTRIFNGSAGRVVMRIIGQGWASASIQFSRSLRNRTTIIMAASCKAKRCPIQTR